MLEYASNSTKCRSLFLLEYFGEKDSYRCGNCDVCTSRNELDLSKIEFNAILDKIKEILTTKPANIETVVDSIKQKPERTLKVIHFLLDNKKIKKTEQGLLEWWNLND
jgi:ATP-dependent DNA helicase RecQ